MSRSARALLVLAAAGLLGPFGTAGPAAGRDRAEPELTFADPAIDESSGLLDQGRLVLTVNDSGDGPYVYAVDKASGETVGTTTYTADAVVDVEAIARGRGGSVWVGDIGDNGGVRAHITVYRLPSVKPGSRTVAAQRFELVYYDGPRDAETLLVSPADGRLYIVSKGLLGGTFYRAPKRLLQDKVNVLLPVATAPGLVTDGGFFPGGRHVIVRDYSSATVYQLPGFRPRAGMRLPDQPQGEGLAVTADLERILVSTEGVHSKVLSVPLPRRVREVVSPSAPESPTARPSTEPDPDGSGSVGGDIVPTWVVAAAAVAATLVGGVALLTVWLGVRASRRRSRRKP